MRHGPFEDALGLLTGAFLASRGIYLLKASHAVTGGTAGLALLLSYGTGLSFGLLYVLTNLPFLALAVRTKGWDFTIRTLISIVLVAGFAYLHPVMMPESGLNAVYAVLVGNLLVGVGMLIIFRHRSSLDVTIILLALTVVPPANVALSAAGAVVLNIVLAFNHRPGRYLGY